MAVLWVWEKAGSSIRRMHQPFRLSLQVAWKGLVQGMGDGYEKRAGGSSEDVPDTPAASRPADVFGKSFVSGTVFHFAALDLTRGRLRPSPELPCGLVHGVPGSNPQRPGPAGAQAGAPAPRREPAGGL